MKIKVSKPLGTSLVAQWLRIHLPTQGTWVRALVREDPTCHGATKPANHNYWAREPQLLKPARLEPVLRNKRSHHDEKPAHRNEEQPPLAATRESLRAAPKTQRSQKKYLQTSCYSSQVNSRCVNFIFFNNMLFFWIEAHISFRGSNFYCIFKRIVVCITRGRHSLPKSCY